MSLVLAMLPLLFAVATVLPLAPEARAEISGPVVGVNPACGTLTDNVFGFNDDSGVPSDFTYTNGSHWCVRVDWYIPPPPKEASCAVNFYVPIGKATALLPVGLIDSAGRKTVVTIDESGAYGDTVVIGKPAGVDNPITHVNIGDNNGQQPGSAQIGWGNFPESVFWACGH